MKGAPRRCATETFRGHDEASGVEGFVRGLRFLSADERDRLVIISSEILDNILSYSRNLNGSRIVARVRASGGTSMVFWFKSDSFRGFAEGRAPGTGSGSAAPPYFDPSVRRYRGLGVAMCERLAKSVRYRSGGVLDAVIVRL
jgi:anti-sigma regulatory factor (Ser/Thr protein kinase)